MKWPCKIDKMENDRLTKARKDCIDQFIVTSYINKLDLSTNYAIL